MSQARIRIAPSVMCADLMRLGQSLLEVERGGADLLHWDVMDGCFVPNLTFGAHFVNAAREICSLPFDVHLMVSDPMLQAQQLRLRAGDTVIFHVNAAKDLEGLTKAIEQSGCMWGAALNPDRPLHQVLQEKVLGGCSMILVMSVFAGFAGQAFIPESLARIRQVAEHPVVREREIAVSVDGGITGENAAEVVRAGARVLVSGSYLLGPEVEFAERLRRLREAAEAGLAG